MELREALNVRIDQAHAAGAAAPPRDCGASLASRARCRSGNRSIWMRSRCRLGIGAG